MTSATLSFLVQISLLCSILLLVIFIAVMVSEKYKELEISNQDRKSTTKLKETNCLSCTQCYKNAQNSLERFMEKFLKMTPIHASLYDNVGELMCVFVSPNLAFLFSFIFLSITVHLRKLFWKISQKNSQENIRSSHRRCSIK